MTFFAGLFLTGRADDQRDADELALRTVLRLDSGARAWRRTGHGIVAHVQSVETPEDRQERQPAVFAGGCKVLVLDGRFDNRPDLIGELGLRSGGGPLSDSAILTSALQRWGEAAPGHLIGDFAFACWDTLHRSLLLVCDQTGGRRLYYSQNPHRIVFATALDAVRAFPRVSRELDTQSLGRLLIDMPLESGRTVYRHIQQLPPAGYLVWPEQGAIVKRYWQPARDRQIRFSRDGDYVEAARDLLDRAVACRLRAAGPVVCYLSGGMDSSGVAATAARLVDPSSLPTVTAVPEAGAPLPSNTGRVFTNEWQHAAAVAALHPNIVAHPAAASPPVCVDPRGLFAARGRPVRNFMNVAWFGMARETVRNLGSRVVLTGLSGNLTLSWQGGRQLADLTRTARLPALGRELRGLWREGLDITAFVRADILAPILSRETRRVVGRLLRQPADGWRATSALSPAFAAEIDASAVSGESHGRFGGMSHDASLRLRHLERMWASRPDADLRGYFGFESRDPLGDIRLIDFCISIPPEQFMRNGVTRRLARRVLADRVPAMVLCETRIGRQIPEWFHRLSHGRRQMVEDLEALEQSALARHMLDLPRMKAIAADWPASVDAAAGKFVPLVAVLARGLNIGQFIQWAEDH